MPRKRTPKKDKARVRNGRLGGLVTASRTSRVDVKARGAKGAAAVLLKFEKQVDPDGVLEPEERTRRAKALRRAFLIRIRGRQS